MHFCWGWGDIINFVLLSQPSSQWDLTWETILTQAVLGSFEWENFFFECWNCTFYKPGMFMGLRLNRSKNTPFYNCPHHCYSKFKVSPLFVTWAVQKFTTCSLDKCFRCCLTLGLRATFVLDTDFWLHVGVSCICVFGPGLQGVLVWELGAGFCSVFQARGSPLPVPPNIDTTRLSISAQYLPLF